MCGRFGSSFTGTDLEEYFELDQKPQFEFKPSYNIAPSFEIPVITRNSPTVARKMKWGFIPSWQKPPDAKFKPINARSDKLTGGFYREAFENSRCLIPASFFYEWKRVTLEGKEEKFPYLIKLKDTDIFGMAGIYSMHLDGEGKEHYFVAIITTEPNSLMKKIHNRMPVIIPKDSHNEWLEKGGEKLLKPYDAKGMEAYRVSDLVNSPKNNSPELIVPIDS